VTTLCASHLGGAARRSSTTCGLQQHKRRFVDRGRQSHVVRRVRRVRALHHRRTSKRWARTRPHRVRPWADRKLTLRRRREFGHSGPRGTASTSAQSWRVSVSALCNELLLRLRSLCELSDRDNLTNQLACDCQPRLLNRRRCSVYFSALSKCGRHAEEDAMYGLLRAPEGGDRQARLVPRINQITVALPS
jgi:hypothetical protein